MGPNADTSLLSAYLEPENRRMVSLEREGKKMPGDRKLACLGNRGIKRHGYSRIAGLGQDDP
jgi:hypothetical protein